MDLESVVSLDLSNSRNLRIISLFLSVQSNDETNHLRIEVLEDAQRLADSGAGGDDIINDEDALALHGSTDDLAALTVVLLLLSVVSVVDLYALGVKSQSDASSEGNTLVGRSKENVELDTRANDGVSVGVGNLGVRNHSQHIR